MGTDGILNQAPGTGSGPDYAEIVVNTQNPAQRNNSPYLPNHLPLLVYTGIMNDIPFPVIDPDNDSLVITSVQPRWHPSSMMPYATGFNVAAPLGAGSSVTYNQTTESFNIQTSLVGKFGVCIEIEEYRNGVKIASSLRNFEMKALSTAALPTFPAPTTPMAYNTCPGQINSIPLSFQDPTATDSVFLTINSPTIPGFSFTNTVAPGPGITTANLAWTTPATADPSTLPDFYFDMTAWDNNCPRRSLARYAVLVRLKQCNTDTVWAGDANADYGVSAFDPLAIAVAYGKTGPTRANATMLWQPEYCVDWTDTFANGVNMKHADCNGDGVVDTTDLMAVNLNWGNTHTKQGGKLKTTGAPDLYFDLAGISFVSGNSVSIPIKLGSTAAPMNNFYGLATTISVGGVTLAAAPTISYSQSWLGTTAQTLSFIKPGAGNTSVNWAYARKDQQNTNGHGTIALLHFTLPAGISTATPLTLSFAGTSMVDNKLNEMPATAFNELDTTVLIVPVGITKPSGNISYATVVPNPSGKEARLHFSMAAAAALHCTITDVAGRVVHYESGSFPAGQQRLALPDAATGEYLIHLSSDGMTSTIKWIKH